MNYYLVISGFLLLVGGFLWERKTWFNAAVKFVLLAMGFWAVFLELLILGYVIHTK